MVCRCAKENNKKCANRRNLSKDYKKLKNIKDNYNQSSKDDKLSESGRCQFFFHSPSSKLPIRDILGEQGKGNKPEPHIEIGAENYWGNCYQRNNIEPFVKKKNKYLFLMTTCRNRNVWVADGKRMIVGYIIGKHVGFNPEGGLFVKGDVFLYNFSDSISVEKLGWSQFPRLKKVPSDECEKIIKLFNGKRNVLKECIKEIEYLDKENMTCQRLSRKAACKFNGQCLR
jgi:hypothetical protein